MTTVHCFARRVGHIILASLGLAMTVSLPAAGANDSTNDAKEPKGATTITLDHPIARVQQAAVNALAVIGCKLRKNEATYLEGKRSNKLGLVVGSGGEMIKVWLTADGEARTTVKVATVKSMLGYAGQRSWNEAIVDEIQKELAGRPPVAPAEPAAATP
jgi:hypothetical protein